MGTEDVKVTAMNMYKYKEGLRFYKRWPCSTLTETFLDESISEKKLPVDKYEIVRRDRNTGQ